MEVRESKEAVPVIFLSAVYSTLFLKSCCNFEISRHRKVYFSSRTFCLLRIIWQPSNWSQAQGVRRYSSKCLPMAESQRDSLPSWWFEVDDEDDIDTNTSLLQELEIDLPQIYRWTIILLGLHTVHQRSQWSLVNFDNWPLPFLGAPYGCFLDHVTVCIADMLGNIPYQ